MLEAVEGSLIRIPLLTCRMKNLAIACTTLDRQHHKHIKSSLPLPILSNFIVRFPYSLQGIYEFTLHRESFDFFIMGEFVTPSLIISFSLLLVQYTKGLSIGE